MAKQYNSWTGFLEDTTSKANDAEPTTSIDKAIRSCDIDFEKDSYFILKYGKYSETILSEGEAIHKFKKAKEQFGSAELVVIKNGKVSRKYN